MEHTSSLDALSAVLQICVIDLLLSGDNAVVIALACRGLPPRLWRRTVLLGTLAAIVLRVILTAMATLVLGIAYLKLIGAVLLIAIAIHLIAQDARAQPGPDDGQVNLDMWKAITTIIVADSVMSLDNVVAVAAAAQGSLTYLSLGLLLSIPILIFGSVVISRVMDRHPILILGGGALLGWVAGATAVSDPALEAWIGSQSFGLAAAAPILGAVYVLLQGRITRERRAQTSIGAAPGPARSTPFITPVPSAPSLVMARAGGDYPAPLAPLDPLAPDPAPIASTVIAAEAARVDAPPEYEGAATAPSATGKHVELIIAAAVLVPLTAIIGFVLYVAWTIRHH